MISLTIEMNVVSDFLTFLTIKFCQNLRQLIAVNWSDTMFCSLHMVVECIPFLLAILLIEGAVG